MPRRPRFLLPILLRWHIFMRANPIRNDVTFYIILGQIWMETQAKLTFFKKHNLISTSFCACWKKLNASTRNDFSVQVMRMKLCKMMQNARTENGATGCLRTLACFSRLPAMSMHVLWHVYSGPWLALACLWWHVYAVTCCLCQDLDLRWHVYDGMFMQLRAACVAHVAFEYEVPNSHSLFLTI